LIKEPRDRLIVDAIKARSALDNIDLTEPLKLGLNNKGVRTLRDELLLQAASSQKNLEDLACVGILKLAFENKKKQIDLESLRMKDKDIKMNIKEELMLRILVDNREVTNCNMQDVDLRRIVNKDLKEL